MIPGAISRFTESEMNVAGTIYAKTDVIFLRGSGAIHTIHPGLGTGQGQMLILWSEGIVTLQSFGNINTGLQEFNTGRYLPVEVPRYRATILFYLKRAGQWMIVQGGNTISSGALHYWKLNDASGGTAVDTIGDAHGTIIGGVLLNQPGPPGLPSGNSAMVFDGVSGKITLEAPVPPVPCSLSVWMKSNFSANPQSIFSSRGVATPHNSHVIVGISQGGRMSVVTGTAAGPSIGNKVVTDDVWHHLVYVFSGAHCIMYADGIHDATVAVTPRVTIVPQSSIGGDDFQNLYWHGSLSELVIWPMPLNAQQINTIFYFGTDAFMREPSQ